MKYADINKKFSAIVAECMSKGYTINTATMGGSQGETAKVDLTDGKEIIRVKIERFYSRQFSGVEIIVGRNTDDVKPNSPDTWATVWNNDLEILHSEKYYNIGRNSRDGDYFGTEEEAIAAWDVSRKRWVARRKEYIKTDLTDKAMEVAKSAISKKTGLKRINPAYVSVYKVFENGFNCYIVSYKGKEYRLR